MKTNEIPWIDEFGASVTDVLQKYNGNNRS